jgi:hypothetical protein
MAKTLHFARGASMIICEPIGIPHSADSFILEIVGTSFEAGDGIAINFTEWSRAIFAHKQSSQPFIVAMLNGFFFKFGLPSAAVMQTVAKSPTGISSTPIVTQSDWSDSGAALKKTQWPPEFFLRYAIYGKHDASSPTLFVGPDAGYATLGEPFPSGAAGPLPSAPSEEHQIAYEEVNLGVPFAFDPMPVTGSDFISFSPAVFARLSVTDASTFQNPFHAVVAVTFVMTNVDHRIA